MALTHHHQLDTKADVEMHYTACLKTEEEKNKYLCAKYFTIFLFDVSVMSWLELADVYGGQSVGLNTKA